MRGPMNCITDTTSDLDDHVTQRGTANITIVIRRQHCSTPRIRRRAASFIIQNPNGNQLQTRDTSAAPELQRPADRFRGRSGSHRVL